MKTFTIHLTIAATADSKSFLTQVKESGRDMYEAKCNALDGWPVGSYVTGAWEI